MFRQERIAILGEAINQIYPKPEAIIGEVVNSSISITDQKSGLKISILSITPTRKFPDELNNFLQV